MNHARPSIAAAIAVLLAANIVLVLVCELRCDVPASNAVVAGCHDAGASATSSRSPFAIGAADDRCTHDALPAVTSVTLQKESRAAVSTGAARTQIFEISPVVTGLPSSCDALLPVFPPPRARFCGSDRSYKVLSSKS